MNEISDAFVPDLDFLASWAVAAFVGSMVVLLVGALILGGIHFVRQRAFAEALGDKEWDWDQDWVQNGQGKAGE